MSIFTKPKKGGIADVIRCDQSDYLVWKWHPNGFEEGELKRENSIRTSSILRVKNGEVAVFFYKSGEDYIEGPHDGKLTTKNFPILSSIIGLWYEGDTPFQAEVYFINLARAEQVRFGVPYFDVVDPRYPDFPVPVSVRGALTFEIDDYKEFIKFYRLKTFTLDDLKMKINAMVVKLVKDSVSNAPRLNNIPVVSIETRIGEVSDIVENNLREKIKENFGVRLKSFDVDAIEVDKESEGYIELKSITKDIVARQARANIENYEEQLRIQREEGQYAQHMSTRQQNLGAYQTEIRGEVGVASAEALGKMGENGAGNINIGEGGGGAGFNPMTIMAGIAVGSAVGKNIANTLDESLNAGGNPVPPPLPPSQPKYHIAQDGKAVGPFEMNKIIEMIAAGQIRRDTLLWKADTPNWEKASSFVEFANFFPPDIPNI